MAILDIQRRQRELGRIRMGDKGGRGQPQKLNHFRLTSAARHLLDHAAALWGGEVKAWTGAPTEGAWELYTATDVLPIVIPPSAEPVSQWYEQWTAGGCTHRCDGVRNQIDDSPCSCDGDARSCKATTRVNVMLPDLPDIGVWRLESHGLNAAFELPGTIEVIQMASATGRLLTGRLRIEHRTSKKAGQTRRFIVPVIDLDVSMGMLMSGVGEAPGTRGEVEAGAPASLPAGGGSSSLGEPFEPESGPLVKGNSAVAPSGGPDVIDGEGTKLVSQAQIGHLMATARELDVSTEDLKLIVQDVCGVSSRKAIPAGRFDALLLAVREAAGGAK